MRRRARDTHQDQDRRRPTTRPGSPPVERGRGQRGAGSTGPEADREPEAAASPRWQDTTGAAPRPPATPAVAAVRAGDQRPASSASAEASSTAASVAHGVADRELQRRQQQQVDHQGRDGGELVGGELEHPGQQQVDQHRALQPPETGHPLASAAAAPGRRPRRRRRRPNSRRRSRSAPGRRKPAWRRRRPPARAAPTRSAARGRASATLWISSSTIVVIIAGRVRKRLRDPGGHPRARAGSRRTSRRARAGSAAPARPPRWRPAGRRPR